MVFMLMLMVVHKENISNVLNKVRDLSFSKKKRINSLSLILAILISRTCPRGLRFNFFLGRCDYSANVACPAL